MPIFEITGSKGGDESEKDDISLKGVTTKKTLLKRIQTSR